jgi:hypothetical protein
MNHIKTLSAGAWARIRTFFQYDISRTIFFELTFAGTISALLYLRHIQYFDIEIRSYIIVLLLFWALLAMLGFFIPMIRGTRVIAVSGLREPGIPIQLNLEARGGFIAGRKIGFEAKIIQLGEPGRDSQEEFRQVYDNFDIGFIGSIAIPIQPGKFLQGSPEAGGISLNKKTLKVRTTIMFNSPGEHAPMFFFHKAGDPKDYGGPLPETLLKDKLVVSPPETWVSLKSYAITYALTLVILLLTLVQLRLL